MPTLKRKEFIRVPLALRGWMEMRKKRPANLIEPETKKKTGYDYKRLGNAEKRIHGRHYVDVGKDREERNPKETWSTACGKRE